MNRVTQMGMVGLTSLAVSLAMSCTDEGVLYLTHGSEEAAGSQCQNGGQQLDYGPDTDADGQLEGTEVTGTAYICNGSASRDALITDTSLAVGDEHCPSGGFALAMGTDANGNGAVDEGEGVTRYVCNGAPAPGADGHDAIFGVSWEYPGAQCSFGGQRLTFGTDVNDSGDLDGDEAEAPAYVCEAQCGRFTCGGGCGSCEDYETCTEGACACTPDCDGLSCGADGCGGSCGSCATDELCEAGACIAPLCQALGTTCTLTDGDPCCTASGEQCAGGLSQTPTCQDCNAPMALSGEFCAVPTGNQCCDGNPSAFVAVKVEGESLVCLGNGVCNNVDCASDDDCPSGGICFRIAAGSPCCPGGEATACGPPPPRDPDVCAVILAQHACSFATASWVCPPTANFAGVDLSGCNLSNGTFNGVTFGELPPPLGAGGANLAFANLSGANLWSSDLTHAVLTNANLAGTTLQDATMLETDLRRANLSNATLVDATLVGTDTTGAPFTNANVTGVTFTDVICPDAINSTTVANTCCGHFSAGAPLTGCTPP